MASPFSVHEARRAVSSTPRLLRLITRLNIGGPARNALLLSRGLAPRFDTILAAGTAPPSEGELSDPGVPVQRVPLVRPVNPVADVRSLSSVRRLLVQHRPVLLHTHMAKAGTIGRVACMTLAQAPRTVHTFHGHVLEGYFGSAVQRTIIETERQLARHTSALVAVSAEIRDQLLSLRIGSPARFHVIPLGLELEPFLRGDRPSGRLRQQLRLEPTTPLVGVVGRLVPIKDHATLLAAMEMVPGAHLAVIGDGELRRHLEGLVRSLGLDDRVHFTGWWSDMAEAVSDLDVVVLTSRNEGTPVALIEASAASRPVVATDVGGVRSVVADGVTGLLTGPGEPQQVAAALRRLLADPAERARMGAAGREHVRERFGEGRLLRDMRELYEDVLAGARTAPRAG